MYFSAMRFTERIILSLFFVLSATGTAIASPHSNDSIYPFLSYKHYGEEEGLLTKTIYASIQDREGFLWFGTDAGVFRYDGKNFKRFTLKDGISDNEVLGLFEDHLGRIWFMSLNGHLSFWWKGKIYNSENTSFLKEAYAREAVFSCFEDKQQRLWFGTQSLGFLLISDDSIKKIKVPDEGKKLASEYIYEDKAGEIWSFKYNKMYKILEKEFIDTLFLPDTIKFHCACHREDINEIFFYSSNGIFRIFNKKVTLYIEKDALPESKDVLKIVSKENYLWICTLNGCYEYKNGKFTNRYLQDRVITSMLDDREGNLWFNTMGESIFMIPANHNEVININHLSGLSGEKIISIASNNGSLWLGYHNGIVDEITAGRKNSYNLIQNSNRSFLRVTGLIASPNITWCGTDLGIYFITDKKINFISAERKKNSSSYYTIKSLMQDKSSTIWGTSTFCFLKIAQDQDGYFIQQDLDSVMRSFSMLEFKNKDYIISCTNGLMEFIPQKKLSLYKTDIDLSSIRIIDMKLDQDSFLILGSAGHGLYIFKNKIIQQHISSSSGLSDDNCNRICLWNNQMYVATNGGLNILEKREGKYSVTNVITTKNGIQSNTINDIISDDTSIYAATDRGLTILHKSFVPDKMYVGKVSITEIITDSVQVLSTDHFIFKSDIPRLLIRFAYPIFNPANIVKIKYRIIRNEKEKKKVNWIYSASNAIEFSSLSPGNYTLQLKPDLENINDKNITLVYFEIKPLWWQTSFIRLFFSILILCVAIFSVRKVTRKRYERQMVELKQQTALEVERNRIASDMHDDLGADLTYIAILGEMVMQNTKSESNAANNLSKLSDASRKVIDKMSEIIWALNSSNDTLSNLISYLHKYSKDFLESQGIECLVTIPIDIPDRKLTAAIRRNIFLIFKEATNNLVKHSGTKKTELTFIVEGSELTIRIKDFGTKIFENNSDHGRNGLKNMKSRALENHGDLQIIFTNGYGTTVEYHSKI
jgi:signal transduction histidine kinase/ligand-binding sensor domain-containing protein